MDLKKIMKKEEMKMVKKALAELRVVSPNKLSDFKDRLLANLLGINAPRCLIDNLSAGDIGDSLDLYDFKMLNRNNNSATFYKIDTLDEILDDLGTFAMDSFAAWHPQYKYEKAMLSVGRKTIWVARLTLKEDS